MENIKINTMPFGKQGVIIQSIIIIIFISAHIWINQFVIELLIITVIFIGHLLLLFRQKYYNTIYFYDQGVEYKKNVILWNDLKITMFYTSNISMGRAYYIAFGSQYFTTDDIHSILKQGFYIMLNFKRLDLILKKYNKKIEILGELGYRQKLYNAVINHNVYCEK